jgi:L-asparaginase
MNRLKFLFSSLAFTVLFAFAAFASCATLPHIVILATGGTIAGVAKSDTSSSYTAGQVGINTLIQAVPEMTKIARISGEQVAQVGSQDMTGEIWLKLAKRVNELLKQRDVDGIVITHGTDTMEETAYFLDLTVHSDKPVVLVGAMRPSNAISADGPANLYNAVVVASSKASYGRGVLVAMNNEILDARDVTKTLTTEVQTFQSPNFGALGYVYDGKTFYQRSPERLHTSKSAFDVSKLNSLPRVGIIMSYASASDIPAKAFINAKFDGIVTAGVGNGNLFHTILDTLAQASTQGLVVVRASRVPFGATTRDAEIDDSKYGFVAAGMLSPQKARILLQLCLTKTHDVKQIQRMFDEY